MGAQPGRDGGLAAIVLSSGEEETLIDAVRSLLAQSQPVETIVASSGGEDPTARLRTMGIQVPVIHNAHPLMPGGARNVGIDATSARFVGFLGANCIAQPDWGSARLRAHRSGADAVSSVLLNRDPQNRSASAGFLLLHRNRTPSAPARDRLLYSLSYDRGLFERFGRFREDLRIGEDSEFNARLTADVRVVWADDVRTAHAYPLSPAGLMRDQFARGRRRGVLQILEPCALWNPPVNVWRVLRNAGGALNHAALTPAAERSQLRRAWPLLHLGSIVYAAGLIAGRRWPTRGWEPGRVPIALRAEPIRCLGDSGDGVSFGSDATRGSARAASRSYP